MTWCRIALWGWVGWISLTLASCRSVAPTYVEHVSLKEMMNLVVANKTDEVKFDETIRKNILPPLLVSEAKLRIEASISVDYYIDFGDPRLRLSYDKSRSNLMFEIPAICAKEPVIHKVQALILEKGILVNEEKECRLILEAMPERFNDYGKQWLKLEDVKQTSLRSASNFCVRMAKELRLNPAHIEVRLAGGL